MPKWWPITLKVPMPRVIRVPEWPPHDWRAWAALVSGIAGGAALTAFAVWVVWIIAFADWSEATEPQRIKWLGLALMLLLISILAVLMAQGLAINRRKIAISTPGGGKVEIEGGGGPAGTAIDKAAKAASTVKREESK